MLSIGFELKFNDYKRTANSSLWEIEQESPDLCTTIPRVFVNFTVSLYIITTANLEMTLDTFYLPHFIRKTYNHYPKWLTPTIELKAITISLTNHYSSPWLRKVWGEVYHPWVTLSLHQRSILTYLSKTRKTRTNLSIWYTGKHLWLIVR